MTDTNILLLELGGTTFALWGVYLSARQNIWCWPVSIIAIIIYVFIFYHTKLYGDSALQLVYLALSGYGWYQWLHGNSPDNSLPVSAANFYRLLLLIAIGLSGTLLLGCALHHYTDSDIPYWDAATTSYGLVATWMMARKIIQHWFFWIIIDITCTGIYLFKGLYITSAQYFLFTMLAFYGYLQWKRSSLS